MVRGLWVVLLVLYAGAALGWEPTWGGEVTFTDKKGTQRRGNHKRGVDPWSPQNQAAMELYYDLAKAFFRGRPDIEKVKYKEEGDKWYYDFVQIRYTDGMRLNVTMDPSCLEIPLPGMTLRELKRHRDRLQRDLFDMMEANGFEAHRRIGGGHLHTGAESTFSDDVMLFTNWVVDQVNHIEIATGARELDSDNTEPFVKLKASQREAFAAVVDRVHRGVIKTPRQFATEFYAKVMFEGKQPTGKMIMAAKYWQLNFLRMANLDTWGLDANESWDDYEAWILFDEVEKEKRTAEMRAKRTYMNVDELIADVELEEGTLRYLRGLTTPLKLSDDFMAGKIPPVGERGRMYYEYVVRAGCDPMKYLFTLPQKGDGVRGWETLRKAYLKAAKVCGEGVGAMAGGAKRSGRRKP